MTDAASLPTGTVTFLFTDIEGSTRLARDLGPRWQSVIEAHNGLLRKAIEAAGGTAVRTEGDAFFAVFSSAVAAVAAAVEGQRALAAHQWPKDAGVRVRMGLHTGEGILGGDDYVGVDVHRAARISDAGHGGQVVLSSATRGLVEEALPDAVTLRDLGEHRLKDFDRPERLWQLVVSGVPADFPPLRTLDVPLDLPVAVTEFVGREAELFRVADLLSRSRLLTLTGPGGTGKTRLAVEAAGRLTDGFPDGVFFVDLSAVTDPRLVAPTVADAVGVREEPGRAILDTLTGHLRDRRILLLLDNFEQVLEGAGLVAELIRAAPGLVALVTSRAPLGLSGEQELPVPPLRLPDPALGPGREKGAEAVALFAARAAAVDPGFVLTTEVTPAVAEICARLDGLPLAIELAAARIRVLPPHAMLERMERRLPLLAGGPRDAPERQRTLRETVGWSYDLLEDAERAFFRRAAVFVGGLSPEAAARVVDPSGDLGDSLDLLEALVRGSLVQGDPRHPGRFGMLETVREFALERLEGSGEAGELRRRHAMWALALAEEAEPHLTGRDRRSWLDHLDQEEDNVRAALDWSVATGEAEVGLRITAALWRHWHLRGHLDEWRRWFEELLALPGAAPRTGLRGRALTGLGGIAYWQGDAPAVRRAYEEALEIVRELGDERAEAEGIYNLAFARQMEGPSPDSRVLYEESRAMFERLGDRRGAASSLLGLALYAHMDGDSRTALDRVEEALRILADAGDRLGEADALDILGAVLLTLGEEERARDTFLRALAVHEEAGDLIGMALDLDGLGSSEAGRGAWERALRLAGAAHAIKESVGGRAPAPLADLLDPVRHLEGRPPSEAAEAALREGRDMTVREALAYAREGDRGGSRRGDGEG